VPTLQEGKYAMKDFEAVVWYGFVGPPGLPQEIANKLASEIENALNTPQVQKIVATIGADTAFLGPQELSRLIERDVKDSRDLIRELQIPQQD
jgi:tripartite-type tricarboxylate transporter receptor subunit TctC